jgi:large subunit ribosomal protein L25
MERIELIAEPRVVAKRSAKTMRREGIIPLVVYGPQTETMHIQAPEFDTKRAINQAGGQLMALHIQGEDEPRMVLAHDVQRDPISGLLLHVDLYEVNLMEKIEVEVPLAFVGEPPLVESGEAILLPVLTSIEVQCLPTDIVQSIEVNVAGLEDYNDALYARDLELPETIELVTSADEMVITVRAVEEEEEEEEEEELFVEVDAGDVEVITAASDEEEEDFE